MCAAVGDQERESEAFVALEEGRRGAETAAARLGCRALRGASSRKNQIAEACAADLSVCKGALSAEVRGSKPKVTALRTG